MLRATSLASVFVGDEPDDDVLGAANVGMRTMLVLAPRERQSSLKAQEMPRRPDLIVGSVCEVPAVLLPPEARRSASSQGRSSLPESSPA